MTDFNATTDAETTEVTNNPEDEAPQEHGGQAEAEGSDPQGSTNEVEYLNVDEHGDRMVTVKIDGEDVEVPFKEAVQGYQRQADYTRKTQELGQLKVLATALENNPAETIKLLQRQYGIQGAQEMVEAAEEQSSAGDGEGSWAENDPVLQRLQAFEPRLQAFERVQAQQELDATLAGLQAKYGDDFDTEAVLTAAVEQGVQDVQALEPIYKQMAFDRVFAQRQAQQEVASKEAAEEGAREAAKTDLGQTVGSDSSAAATSSAPPPKKYASIEEAYAAAKAEAGLA